MTLQPAVPCTGFTLLRPDIVQGCFGIRMQGFGGIHFTYDEKTSARNDPLKRAMARILWLLLLLDITAEIISRELTILEQDV